MRLYLPLAIVVLLVTCADPLGPRYPDAALDDAAGALTGPDRSVPVVVGDVTYHVEPHIPMPGVLQIDAWAARQIGGRVELPGGECVIEVRLHDSPQRTTPVWTASTRATSCEPQGYGQTYRTFLVSDILGDSLPAGPYHVEARLHVDGRVIPVIGGAVYLHPDRRAPIRAYDQLRLHSAIAVQHAAPRELTVQLGLHNPLDRAVRIEYGACAVVLRAHRRADYTDPPVWRSEYAGDPRLPHVGRGCIAILYGSLIQAGEVLRHEAFRTAVPVYEILADSLPDGTYFIAAELTVLHDTVRTVNGQTFGDQRQHRYAAALGAVQLQRQEPPLPATRTRDGFRYSAALQAAGDSARVSVTVTNVAERSLPLQIAPSCALQPVFWNSAALRDQVPPPQPDWAPATGCRLEYAFDIVAPGDSRTYTTSLPVTAVRSAISGSTAWGGVYIYAPGPLLLATGELTLR